MKTLKTYTCLLISLCAALCARAGDRLSPVACDSLASAGDSLAVTRCSAPGNAAVGNAAEARKPLLARLMAMITDGNVDRTHERPIDLSFVMYPSYSHEPGLGIGGALTGLYRVNRRDSVMVPSDCFLSFNASLRAFFQVYIKGNHLFPDNRTRLGYVVELYSMPLKFRGITAEDTGRNPDSKYHRYQVDVQANLVREIIPNLYAGVRLRSNYTAVSDVLNPEYLLGERRSFFVNGLGLVAEYDSRDNLLSPTHGLHLMWRSVFYWHGLGSADASFWNHTAVANYYTPMWTGSVLALDLYASFNSKSVPWTMREMIASDGIRMRGYYMGTYMDNCQATVQAEYRQHLYRRLGFTLWGGAGAFFPSLSDAMDQKHRPRWLPNAGIGLRFEIKHNANIRLDCGFGKHDSGITFAFGEAF